MPPTFGTGRCDCARSDRVWEVAGGYTSRESHVRRWPDDVAVGESLLGNHAQFCHAFFHISPTPELVEHPGEVCVRCVTHPGGKKCETKGVVVVAALRESDDGENKNKNKVTFLSRYSNCPLSEHAEEFLLRDPALLDAIRKIPISMSHHPRGSSSSRTHRTLTLYQRLQPCHRSSDNRDGWSCSEALVENLWRRELLPRGISLDVAVSYTYRAHWDVSGMKPRDRAWFGPAVEAARRGIRVFANATGTGTGTGTEETGKEEGHSSVVGVRLRALREEDWKFLVSLCDDDVQEDYRRVFDATSSSSHDNDDNDDNDNDDDDDDRNRNGRKAVGGGGVGGDQGFTSAIARHRRAMDAFVEAQIRLHSSSSSSSSSLSSLSLSAAEDSTEGKEPKTFAEKMRLKRLAAGGAHTTGSDGHNHGHGGASSASASESGQAAASFRNGRSGDGDWCDNRRWSKGGGKGGDRGGGYERGGDRGGGRRGVPASGGAASETRSREW